ncbi:hypothetical protein IMCC20628_00574 [Hoeflea sp. IMCC20628]|uniref:hypothetical protein n=1 Tax=Hoeflea sp. IMCC20628 TaxID=1620421 RepID=UPI00063ACFFF|nr:hypothetical protein [Hoeflea sp. IMCC20628]AKH99298.1 hypothetical protein IMCC20628_00574 [Hoeflea sp. IMCC20628]
MKIMLTPALARTVGIIFLASLFAAPAAADMLQIDGKYGNSEGCAFDPEQGAMSDNKIIVSPQNVEFHESGCDFLQVLSASYGRAVVTALCSGEGEEWVSTYLVRPSYDDPAALHFKMQGGDEFEFTVSRCE